MEALKIIGGIAGIFLACLFTYNAFVFLAEVFSWLQGLMLFLSKMVLFPFKAIKKLFYRISSFRIRLKKPPSKAKTENSNSWPYETRYEKDSSPKVLFHKKYPPTQKEKGEIDNLIEFNNQFRAHPKLFHDWCDRFSKTYMSSMAAQILIKRLRKENDNFSKELLKQVINQKPYTSNQIRSSDIQKYTFCARSAYLNFQGKIELNFSEKRLGTTQHGSGSSKKERPKIPVKNFQDIDPTIKRIEWFDSKKQKNELSKSLNLTGKCDGIAHHNDNRKSILEFKTSWKASKLKKPYDSDILQAASYHHLYSQSLNLGPNMYIVYNDTTDKKARAKIFERSFEAWEPQMLQAHKDIEDMRKSNSIPPKKPEAERSLCRKCGYRSTCYKRQEYQAF